MKFLDVGGFVREIYYNKGPLNNLFDTFRQHWPSGPLYSIGAQLRAVDFSEKKKESMILRQDPKRYVDRPGES